MQTNIVVFELHLHVDSPINYRRFQRNQESY